LLRHGFQSKSRVLKIVHPSRENIFFLKGILMAPHQTSERWHEICALAAEEQDVEQMQMLTRKIIRLLEDKERRLKERSQPRRCQRSRHRYQCIPIAC
jgi:hypothetical protein